MVNKTNFIHVHTAALHGLPKAVSGDQALVHCLALAQQVNAPAENNGCESARKGHLAAGALRHFTDAEEKQDREQLERLIDHADPKKGGHRSGPLLLCGAALELVQPKNAIKTAGVGFELPFAELFNLELAGIRNNPSAHPVTDGALIAAQRTSRQLLIAVMAGYLFGGHGAIMALAIWHLP